MVHTFPDCGHAAEEGSLVHINTDSLLACFVFLCGRGDDVPCMLLTMAFADTCEGSLRESVGTARTVGSASI